VVAAAEHLGDSLVEFFDTQGNMNPIDDVFGSTDLAQKRVADVSAVIDYLETQNAASDTCFSNKIDMDKIGIFGHSFGAFTTVAASSGVILGIAGPDERISTALPIAPAGALYLRAVDDPIAVLGAELDGTGPFDSEAVRIYDRADGPKHLVKLLGAGHFTPSEMCQFRLGELVDALGYPPCAVCDIVKQECPGGIDKMNEMRPAMQYLINSFFIANYAQDPLASQAAALIDPSGSGPTDYPQVWSQIEVTVP
jgi:predicted dienelactone hydrolase